MNKVFNDFAAYVRAHDGRNKPKIDFQDMYKLFPGFEFTTGNGFGSYKNFGEAFEQKVYDMVVATKDSKHVCYMTYREYMDADENTAYAVDWT